MDIQTDGRAQNPVYFVQIFIEAKSVHDIFEVAIVCCLFFNKRLPKAKVTQITFHVFREGLEPTVTNSFVNLSCH